MENTKDIFGDSDELFGADKDAAKNQAVLDINFKPTSEKDFVSFAKIVSDKVTPYEVTTTTTAHCLNLKF